MILGFLVCSLAVGVLAALAGWLLEQALGALGRPRRIAWIVALGAALILPVLAMLPRDSVTAAAVSGDEPALAETPGMLRVVQPVMSELGEARVGAWTLDEAAALLWIAMSAIVLLNYGVSARRLSRQARRWRETLIDDQAVALSPDLGPAVFGWRRPTVIFPAWLLSAPAKFQRLVLAHEAHHVAARDPQLLASATVLAALFPWNPALVWMLRRFRFAMEVDCDARVLRGGADAGDYGMALLYVTERQARAPATAIALTARPSQLERRIDIMLSSPRRLPGLLSAACIALAGTCIAAAATLEVPAPASPPVTLLKPPPGTESMGFKLGRHFEKHIAGTYPELMGGNFDGMPMIVVLMNDDWSIAKSAKTMNPDPKGEVHATNELFGLLGVPPGEAPYVGAMNMQMAPGKLVVMVYTERQKPGERFVSKIFPDTRKQDRELFEASFPHVTTLPGGYNPWVLLDRSGKVLRTGIEATTPQWHETLEQRFHGIDTQEVTVTPLTRATGEPLQDANGRDVQLFSVWLAPGSALPAN